MGVLNLKEVKNTILVGEISGKLDESGLSQEEFLAELWNFYKKYEGTGKFIESTSSIIDKKNKLLAEKIKIMESALEVMKIVKEMKLE